MVQYAKEYEGNITVGLPTTGELSDGSTVSGYNLLDSGTLKREGWLPLVENKPVYDPATQYLAFDAYTVSAYEITVNYKVIDIVVPEPQPATPTLSEQVAELQAQNAQMLLALVQGGLM